MDTKTCPKCGKEISAKWYFHRECGWGVEEEEEEQSVGTSKIEVFTSPTCPNCHPALKLAKKVAKERGNVKVKEINTATRHGQRRAQRFGINALPTLFVSGPGHLQKIGIVGIPSEKRLLNAIDISLGLAEWKEPKGFLDKLREWLT